MAFLQTAFLFSLVAMAIPILLHLFSRWQTEQIELGTIRFLREVLTENVRRRRIRRWLLLTTRMLLLALLALLFARPFFYEATKRDGDRRRVILIDRSASMSMQGTQGKAIDVAIEKAISSAKELGADAKIDWAWFDSKVVPFLPNEGGLRLPSSKSVSTTGHTNYAAAIAWARDRLAEDNRAKSDVVMITDLQRRGLGDPTEIHFPPDVPFQIIDVGRDAASNLAVSRIDIAIGPSKPTKKELEAPSQEKVAKSLGNERTPYNPGTQGMVRPDQTLFVHTTLFNYGAVQREDIPLVVTARQGSKTTKVRSNVSAKPEQATESQIELGKLGLGEWEISVEADLDDDLNGDNRRVHAVAVDDAPKILIIGDHELEGVTTTGTFFVNKALSEGIERDRPRFGIQTVSTADAIKALANPSAWKTIVLADATNVDSSLISSMERYVKLGGQVLAFTGHIGGELGAAKWNNSPLAPGRFEQVRIAGVVPFRLSANERGHAILQPFDDPQTGDLQRLSFNKVIGLRVSATAKVLASFDKDLPGIVEVGYKKGRLVWFMSDAGNPWSNWANSPLYLPLVHQMVCDLAGLSGEGLIRFRSVGDVRMVRSDGPSSDSNADAFTRVKLSGEKRIESAFENAGFVRDENTLYVVNTQEGESDTARMTEADLRKAFGLLAPNDEGSEIIAANEVKSIKKNEMWPWLAASMILLLVFEFGLSNRTPP